jgi:hypothetical protein
MTQNKYKKMYDEFTKKVDFEKDDLSTIVFCEGDLYLMAMVGLQSQLRKVMFKETIKVDSIIFSSTGIPILTDAYVFYDIEKNENITIKKEILELYHFKKL